MDNLLIDKHFHCIFVTKINIYQINELSYDAAAIEVNEPKKMFRKSKE